MRDSIFLYVVGPLIAAANLACAVWVFTDGLFVMAAVNLSVAVYTVFSMGRHWELDCWIKYMERNRNKQ